MAAALTAAVWQWQAAAWQLKQRQHGFAQQQQQQQQPRPLLLGGGAVVLQVDWWCVGWYVLAKATGARLCRAADLDQGHGLALKQQNP